MPTNGPIARVRAAAVLAVAAAAIGSCALALVPPSVAPRSPAPTSSPAQAPSSPSSGATDGALSLLLDIKRDAAVRTQARCTWRIGQDGLAQPTIWVAGEFDAVAAVKDERWENGANVSVEATAPDGTVLDGGARSLDRDSRYFLVSLPPSGTLAPGDYSLRVIAKPVDASVGATDTLHVTVPPAGNAGQFRVGEPLLFRRGPFSGPDWEPAGDLRYHRQERVKVETAIAGPVTARAVQLLDRAGHPLHLPVIVDERDAAGITVVSGEVVLAPLGQGDFILETTVRRGADTERRLAAFRIVP